MRGFVPCTFGSGNRLRGWGMNCQLITNQQWVGSGGCWTDVGCLNVLWRYARNAPRSAPVTHSSPKPAKTRREGQWPIHEMHESNISGQTPGFTNSITQQSSVDWNSSTQLSSGHWQRWSAAAGEVDGRQVWLASARETPLAWWRPQTGMVEHTQTHRRGGGGREVRNKTQRKTYTWAGRPAETARPWHLSKNEVHRLYISARKL